MKPHRLRMTHQLILSYGLYRKMEVYRPKISTSQQLQQFHSEDYIEFLKKISPDNTKLYIPQMQKFNLGIICVNDWYYVAILCQSLSISFVYLYVYI
jgi:histone deacetylase 1/2